MTGETFLHQKSYTSAIESYAALADDTSYPNWQAAGLLQIGKCFESMENIEQAVESYSRVVDEFGDSGSAEKPNGDSLYWNKNRNRSDGSSKEATP